MKIYAVCGFGCGSSMILRLTIEKVLRELGVEAEVENTDMTGGRSGEADVIFTSPELKDELERTVGVPVYPISRYTDVNEVRTQVKNYLSSRNN